MRLLGCRNGTMEKGERMKLIRSVLALAGLGLIAALAMGSGAAVAQSATPAPAKIGSSLIGKLEGPEIILDAKAFPKTFKEAPILAEQVKAGKLPSVDKRLPEPSQLFVVKPLREIGKYGGNWRRAFTGPADHENANRINALDKILTFDYTGTKIIPSLARDWKMRKVDDYTVAFEFPEPYAFFVYQLAGSTGIGGGLARSGGFQMFGGANA